MSDNGKLAFLFLLTHPHMTALGAMRGTLAGLAAELEWTPEAFRKAFREALSKGMAEVDERACFIWLPNFLKYNKPENPNVLKAWGSAWDLLPECDLKTLVFRHVKAFTEGLPEGFRKAFREAWPQPSRNQEPEPKPELEQEPSPPLIPSPNASPTTSPPKEQGGGGGFLIDGWDGVGQRLRKLGMGDTKTAIDTARANGLTSAAVDAIANVWEGGQPAWALGALHWRIANGAPDQDPTEGWPPPDQAAVKAAPPERDRANHLGQSLCKSLRHLPPEERDRTIREKLEAAGFTEAAMAAAGYPALIGPEKPAASAA